ncbi:hypothetical protein L6E12_03885 [Actinokineospora sp. PR83]|uniref:hypothetical protein n=1 Tax=Actinokineospora sp. PR83 TaxID=2884908 RepID=UPI001F25BAE0|nr:hypothetical protein [Actinokineospora sp. PR83]MCG8914929.1 hypothetical protein [Actinokineospora sp. PR83]
MRFTPDEVVAELRALRRGRGVQKPGVTEQLGPALRFLCGISPADDPAVAQVKLLDRLRALIGELPEDLGLVVAVAMGLHPETRHKFLRERAEWLAARMERDPRTVRRRIDEGVGLLVEQALAGAVARRDDNLGWYVRRFEAVLRYDRASPECLERRCVVAERPELAEIELSFTVPPASDDPPELLVEPVHGVTMTGVRRVRRNRFTIRLALPRPLQVGEEHDFTVITRTAAHQSMRSHYVFFPERRCDEFDLRVRFAPGAVPARVWGLAEAFPRDVDEIRPSEDILVPDALGEVHVAFDHPRTGLGYGAQWA